jgi:hypothetical protein
MKGKFGAAALLFSGITFAVPVSTPNQLSDTPIISGGGSGERLSMNNCRAYQTNGAAINLSGGETLVFYGGGRQKNGGYLATKTTYSGTGYVKLSKRCYQGSNNCPGADNTAIGLFARNTDARQDFIAGAGGGFDGASFYSSSYSSDRYTYTCSPASGGGWQGEPAYCTETKERVVYISQDRVTIADTRPYMGWGGSVQGGYWFNSYPSNVNYSSPGFHGSDSGGGASSISAFYNSYTKDYTSPTTSATITGGGITGQGRLYVCQ